MDARVRHIARHGRGICASSHKAHALSRPACAARRYDAARLTVQSRISDRRLPSLRRIQLHGDAVDEGETDCGCATWQWRFPRGLQGLEDGRGTEPTIQRLLP